jgi:hypothetical protein
MACPGAPYTVQHSLGALMDTRGCGPCMCGTPTATCAGAWNFYSGPGCSGPITLSITANGACDATGNQNTSQSFQSNALDVAPTNVTCATPPTPPSNGTVTLTGADTICCN